MKRLVCLVLVLALAGCGAKDALSTGSGVAVDCLEEFRDFGGFTAAPPSGGESARQLVEAVLGQYPEGFCDQWGAVEILLVGALTGTGEFAGERYAGFTQRTGDGWRMVLDAQRLDAGTVHHEIAHILDGILTEAGALTEEEWMGFCPSGFVYGGGDWSLYPDFFVDDYAMTNLQEDRARTFEEAVLRGAGVYEGRPALWLKLEYFCRAIRGHFDTGGWPEKTIWELGLK